MTETGAQSSGSFAELPIPAKAGIGLRHPHVLEIIEQKPDIAWLEVHSENYLAAGGARMRQLEAIREDYPLSCHGVALSLGSSEGLDREHLSRLRDLFDRFDPGLVSDHVSWTTTGGAYLNDLLPLPYTGEALDVICRNVDQAQDAFGRRMLVENPSSYVTFHASTMPEWVFMAEIAARTGCGILLDVNNIYVSSRNHNFDARAYIDAIPAEAVGEVHIAGHTSRDVGGGTILIDDHSSAPIGEVWDLLDHALARLGPVPVLMEWDGEIPALEVLTGVAEEAQRHLDRTREAGLAHVA
jgi:uncharacterized protein (UPF0276 family)